MREESEAERLARWFQEFLTADERGIDREEELLLAAGAQRAALAAKIRLHRQLKALGGAEAPPTSAAAQQRLGRFEILGSLGQGGISRVLLAFDPKMNRRVALKLIEREMLLDKDQRTWILNEARGLASTSHPGVVQVYEVGEAGPHTYVAMELLTGPSLHELIAEWARRRAGGDVGTEPGPDTDPARVAATRELAARLEPYSRRIQVLAELAEALAHCHDHGVLHRDIKPKNVLFDAEGHPKLIDFGLAHVEGADDDSRLELTQSLVGTVAYLAPEQVTNERTGADPRSDQFSFGTLAYECCALENPFQRKTQRTIKLAIEEANPPPLGSKAPALPTDLARVVHHALELEPEARYPDMGALAADLRAILAHQPLSISAPSLAHLGRLWARRHKKSLRVALGASACIFALLALAWSTITLQQRNRIAEALASIDPAALQQREEFGTVFTRIEDIEDEAVTFDVGWVRGSLWGGLGARTRDKIAALSLRLGEVARADPELARGEGTAEGQYQVLFQLDQSLCPSCTGNEDFRRRGQVVYPAQDAAHQSALYRVVPKTTGHFGGYATIVPVEPTEHLAPGDYRLQHWRIGADALEGETEFVVERGWRPALELTYVSPRAEFFEHSFEIPANDLEDQGERAHVCAFRILDHVVTVAEYAEFLTDNGIPATSLPGLLTEVPQGPASPAAAEYVNAQRCAHWIGGRLPTACELERANLVRPIFPRGPRTCIGEYVADPDPATGGRMWLSYKPGAMLRERMNPVLDPHAVVPGKDASDAITLVAGFRVVFSGDHPEAQRALARAELEKQGAR
ncbi:MAG: hypothetical protein EXS08_07745 [Planctomycetes bacterium]|nr:hypothetical protein [Planctomycetota bacterium]